MNPEFRAVDGVREALRMRLWRPRRDASEIGAPDEENEDREADIPTPDLDEGAYHGILGGLVREIAPHTEASPAGLLVCLLTAVGCVIGREPHQVIDGARHGGNLFMILVGPSSSGRKGTAVAWVRRILDAVEPSFANRNIKTGLSSGEGVIYHVRDGDSGAETRSKSSDSPEAGIVDKRLLVIEDEFASALRRKRARENTLSPTLRSAWDGTALGTLTKGAPLRATNTHIAIVAQISPQEMRALVETEDVANGFLNRFLVAYVERAQLLPNGGEPSARPLSLLYDDLRQAVAAARQRLSIELSDDARSLWKGIYVDLTIGDVSATSALSVRAAPIVRRIAMIFALLDRAPAIEERHLEAAVSVWRYSTASAAFAFRHFRPLTPLAQRILISLDEAGTAGLTRSDIRKRAARSNNVTAETIQSALQELRDVGLARIVRREKSGGRPREIWLHVRHALSVAANRESMGDLGEKSSHLAFSPISPKDSREAHPSMRRNATSRYLPPFD